MHVQIRSENGCKPARPVDNSAHTIFHQRSVILAPVITALCEFMLIVILNVLTQAPAS